jgi:broad-specificity NMP kinase
MLKGTPGLEKKDMTKVLNKIKYDRFKEKIWIDEKTFRYQKAELDVNMDMEGLKLEEHLQMNVKGDFNGKIEVPEQVKKKARSM